MWQNHSKYVSEYVSKKSPSHVLPLMRHIMKGGFFCVFNPAFSPQIGSHPGVLATICTCAGTTTE